MQRQPIVYILILNWNGWQDTILCLESILNLNYLSYRIVVIDNGSTDESISKLNDWSSGKLESNMYNLKNKPVQCLIYDRTIAEAGGIVEQELKINTLPSNQYFILIKSGTNLGYAGGNNIGIRYALKREVNYIWILNNDTIVEPDALQFLVDAMYSSENIGMVGSLILYANNPKIIWFAGGSINPWWGCSKHKGMGRNIVNTTFNICESDYLAGCSFLIRSAMIKQIGLMDESYFLYYEDTDWSIRARHAGWIILFNPSSKIYHKVSSKTLFRSPFQDYYLVRNMIKFTKKYYYCWLPFTYLYLIFHVILPKILHKQFKRLSFVIKAINDANLFKGKI